jgi:hypothetical protein
MIFAPVLATCAGHPRADLLTAAKTLMALALAATKRVPWLRYAFRRSENP